MTHIADSAKKGSQSLPLLPPKRPEIMTAIIECLSHTGHCAEHSTSIPLLTPVSNCISLCFTDAETEVWWGKSLPKATNLLSPQNEGRNPGLSDSQGPKIAEMCSQRQARSPVETCFFLGNRGGCCLFTPSFPGLPALRGTVTPHQHRRQRLLFT